MTKFALIIFLLVSSPFVLPVFPIDEDQEQSPVPITNRSTVPQTIDGQTYYFHAVLQGQTLYSIARAYGVEEEAILEENPDILEGLRYDRIIRIPAPEELDDKLIRPVRTEEVAPEPEGDFVVHEVRSQETLFGLSQRYAVSQESILYYNPPARQGLQVGQILRIPLPEEEVLPDGMYLHRAEAGETKYGLATAAGLSVEELEDLNPHIREELLAGQQVLLPLGKDVPSQVETDAEPLIVLPVPAGPGETAFDDTHCLDPLRKDQYNVALLIPLYLEALLPSPDTLLPRGAHRREGASSRSVSLEEAGPDDLRKLLAELPPDHVSFSFLSYYHGVLMAVDSVKRAGANIQLHVYDVCQDVRKARRLVEGGGLLEMDLIIGPFHRQSLGVILSHTSPGGIPLVSPLLPDQDQLMGNAFLFNATPSLGAMLARVAEYVAKHYPKQNILIVHNNQAEAADIIGSFRDSLLTRVAMVNHFYDSLNLSRIDGYYLDGSLVGNRRVNVPVMTDTGRLSAAHAPQGGESLQYLPVPPNVIEVIFHQEGMDGLLAKMRKDRHNVLITLVGGEPFLSNYLRQLHGQRRDYDMTIFGIPQWEEYRSIEIDYLQDLRVHLFSGWFFDYGDMHIRSFVERYRRVFHTEPDEDAFIAVQTAHYFFTALMDYGPDFPSCMPLLNQARRNSPFLFQRYGGAENGWENRHAYIHRIQNYRRVDVQRPMELSEGP